MSSQYIVSLHANLKNVDAYLSGTVAGALVSGSPAELHPSGRKLSRPRGHRRYVSMGQSNLLPLSSSVFLFSYTKEKHSPSGVTNADFVTPKCCAL